MWKVAFNIAKQERIIMTDNEYQDKKQQCWEEYISLYGLKNAIPEDAFSFTFDRAYALGKQEKDAEETVIQGWVARDNDGDLFFYTDKPRARKREGVKWKDQVHELQGDVQRLKNIIDRLAVFDVNYHLKREKPLYRAVPNA